LLHSELAQKIGEALAELPENQRTAILLCRQEDLSYEEIAKVLGCSLSATKSLIHRGREVLKQKLKPYLRTGDWHESYQFPEAFCTFSYVGRDARPARPAKVPPPTQSPRPSSFRFGAAR
jgi:hypothetical protein